MARYDIKDFDVSSVLNSVGRLRSRNKRSRFQEMLPALFEGFVGVYDRYQEDKLTDLINETNFENKLELGKLRADAAKQAKIYKETQPVYEDLLKQGVSFTEDLKPGTANFKKVERALGGNALDTLASQYGPNSRLDDKDLFKNFNDVKKHAKAYLDLSDEDLENIEANYMGLIKDEYNRVKTGQSFDYDAFNQAQQELANMEIDPDIAKSGLLSKLSGRVKRRIESKDRTIDSFRNTYVSAPVQNAVNAFKVFETSQSPQEYDLEMFNKDSGYLSFLPADALKTLTALSPNTKKVISHTMQTDLKNEDSFTEQKVVNSFNRALYGAANPSDGLKYLANRRHYKDSQATLEFNNQEITKEEYDTRLKNNAMTFNRQKDVFREFSEEDAKNYIRIENTIQQLPEDSSTRKLMQTALDARNFNVVDQLYGKYIVNNFVRGEIAEFNQNLKPLYTLDDFNALITTNPNLQKETIEYYKNLAVDVSNPPSINEGASATNRADFDAVLENIKSSVKNSTDKTRLTNLIARPNKTPAASAVSFKNLIMYQIQALDEMNRKRQSVGLSSLFPEEYNYTILINEVMPKMVFEDQGEGYFFKVDPENKSNIILRPGVLNINDLYGKLQETINLLESEKEPLGENGAVQKNKDGSYSIIPSENSNESYVQALQEDVATLIASKNEDIVKLNQTLRERGYMYDDGNISAIYTPEQREKMRELRSPISIQRTEREIKRLEGAKSRMERLSPDFTSASERSLEIDKELEQLNRELEQLKSKEQDPKPEISSSISPEEMAEIDSAAESEQKRLSSLIPRMAERLVKSNSFLSTNKLIEENLDFELEEMFKNNPDLDSFQREAFTSAVELAKRTLKERLKS
tara:strand:- start:396 stop:2993 length:2598 start_codon:yes stop_codon:yes gene_type:complete